MAVLDRELAAEAVRARGQLVVAVDRPGDEDARAGRRRVALEVGGDRLVGPAWPCSAVPATRRSSLPLGTLGARDVPGDVAVLEAQLPAGAGRGGDRDELPRLLDVEALAEAGVAGRADVVAAGDPRLRVLITAAP